METPGPITTVPAASSTTWAAPSRSGDGHRGPIPVLEGDLEVGLSRKQTRVLLAAVLIVATCGILYELIVGTLSSYLLGNSALHFSLTIGGFMTAMGLGSWASRFITRDALAWFVAVELAVGAVGGLSAAVLYAAFTYTPVYHVAMGGIVLAIGVLIGLEIPFVTRLLGGPGDVSASSVKDTVANVLAVDYLGALVASIAFPFLLLPILGVVRTAFITGFVNLIVVVMCVRAFRRSLGRARRPLTIATVLVAVLLLAGAIGADRLADVFETKLYRDPVVYTEQSTYQRIVLTARGGDLRMFLDGGLQFSTSDEHRYHEALVHPAMALAAQRERILILGGGDGMAAREVLEWPEVTSVTLVDLDPAVTTLSRTHAAIRAANRGALEDARVEIVNDDAGAYLAETVETFDVILIDLPDPNHESLAKLYSRPFYSLVRERLGVGGMVAVQSTSPTFAREAFWSIVTTAESAGLHPEPYHLYIPSFGDWGFFLGSTHAVRPERYDPAIDLEVVTPATFEAARHFDADVDRVEVEVSTLDNPVVLRYYQKGWQQWQ